jgi:hypothetical protein
MSNPLIEAREALDAAVKSLTKQAKSETKPAKRAVLIDAVGQIKFASGVVAGKAGGAESTSTILNGIVSAAVDIASLLRPQIETGHVVHGGNGFDPSVVDPEAPPVA